MVDKLIQHVSDTALLTAVLRAGESDRPDALFHDPLAAKLAGERGLQLFGAMQGERKRGWSVAVRTVVIDELVREGVAAGADAVLSLGAGLDTRPYRLELPTQLRWIEVDYRELVELKDERLAGDAPRCRLERVGLDLREGGARRELFARVGGASSKVLVLTEGLVPYLAVDDAASLADDLRAPRSFSAWITDYIDPALVCALQGRMPMENAPLLFAPPDWHAFFAQHGWTAKEMRYLADASDRLGREVPYPPAIRHLYAYALLAPNAAG